MEKVHQRNKLFVSHKDKSVRMFQNGILDLLSRVPFWVPIAIYLPLIIFLLTYSIFANNINILWVGGLFVGGVFLWTFAEYILHRFVFHYVPSSKIGKRIHFIAHGVHHDYPNDSMRLVMPPSISIPLAVLFYGLFYLIFGAVFAMPFFAGFAMGYLIYDELHYATHHANWKAPIFQKIKKHHMQHHYKTPNRGFGVSSFLWDIVFGSGFNESSSQKPNK